MSMSSSSAIEIWKAIQYFITVKGIVNDRGFIHSVFVQYMAVTAAAILLDTDFILIFYRIKYNIEIYNTHFYGFSESLGIWECSLFLFRYYEFFLTFIHQNNGVLDPIFIFDIICLPGLHYLYNSG